MGNSLPSLSELRTFLTEDESDALPPGFWPPTRQMILALLDIADATWVLAHITPGLTPSADLKQAMEAERAVLTALAKVRQ